MPIISYESTGLVADASHAPTSQAFGDLPAVGVSVQSARSDHKHGLPSFGSVNNVFFGTGAGLLITTGNFNSFFGYNAGFENTEGTSNCFFGYGAGYNNTIGRHNCFFGYQSGGNVATGWSNFCFGYQSGVSLPAAANNNVFLGNLSGFYETGNYKLFIDNASRASEADGRVKALIYGVFAALTADQLLSFNAATINMPYLPTADPHVAGQLWKNSNVLTVSAG